MASEILSAVVTVAGDDVVGVVLAPVRPATVTGRIVFDSAAPSLLPSQIILSALPKTPGFVMPLVPTTPPVVHDDFTFELNAHPGAELLIRAVTRNANWMVKSVTIGGKDVTDSGVEIIQGQDLDDVQIVMTDRVQGVSGLVTNARGDIAKNASVFAFSQSRDRWFGPTRYVGIVRPDQDGRYTIRQLPPGDYYLVAVEYLDLNRRGDPAYLEQLAENAVRFTLMEGETASLDLKLAAPR